jgi:transposase-like protein
MDDDSSPGYRDLVWVYLYRAVDKQGRTVDFHLSRNRVVEAAKQFLRKAMKNQRVPSQVTLHAYSLSPRVLNCTRAFQTSTMPAPMAR